MAPWLLPKQPPVIYTNTQESWKSWPSYHHQPPFEVDLPILGGWVSLCLSMVNIRGCILVGTWGINMCFRYQIIEIINLIKSNYKLLSSPVLNLVFPSHNFHNSHSSHTRHWCISRVDLQRRLQQGPALLRAPIEAFSAAKVVVLDTASPKKCCFILVISCGNHWEFMGFHGYVPWELMGFNGIEWGKPSLIMVNYW